MARPARGLAGRLAQKEATSREKVLHSAIVPFRARKPWEVGLIKGGASIRCEALCPPCPMPPTA